MDLAEYHNEGLHLFQIFWEEVEGEEWKFPLSFMHDRGCAVEREKEEQEE